MTDWKSLRSTLGLTISEEDDICSDYKDSQKKQKCAFLHKWKDRKGNRATYRVFSNAATKVKNKKLSDAVIAMGHRASGVLYVRTHIHTHTHTHTHTHSLIHVHVPYLNTLSHVHNIQFVGCCLATRGVRGLLWAKGWVWLTESWPVGLLGNNQQNCYITLMMHSPMQLMHPN